MLAGGVSRCGVGAGVVGSALEGAGVGDATGSALRQQLTEARSP